MSSSVGFSGRESLNFFKDIRGINYNYISFTSSPGDKYA